MRGSGAAWTAIVLGLASLASMPVGALVAQRSASIGLIESLYASVPTTFVLGLAAWSAVRRARFALDRSVTRDSAGLVLAGRLLAWLGLYAALIGAIALAVYAVLHYRQ